MLARHLPNFLFTGYTDGKAGSPTWDPITLGLGGFQFPNDMWHHLAGVKAGRVDASSNRNKVPLFLRKLPCLGDDDRGVPNIAQYDPCLLFNTSTLTESLCKPPEFMLQEPTERPPILQTLGSQRFNVEREGLADIESCED